MRSLLLALLCLLDGGGAHAPPTGAQDVPLPAELHYLLLAKALSFDRALYRFGDELVIAVVYQEEYPESRNAAATFVRGAAASPASSVNGIALRVVRVPLHDVVDVTKRLRELGADVVYLAPLRAVKVRALVEAARGLGAATCTGVPAYTSHGVALAFSRRGERGHLLVSVEQARAEGSEYGSQLLSWAEVVR